MSKICRDISHGRTRWQRVKVGGDTGLVCSTLFLPFLFRDGVDGGHALRRRVKLNPSLQSLEFDALSFPSKEDAHVRESANGCGGDVHACECRG